MRREPTNNSPQSGTYALILRVDAEGLTVRVGALGDVHFQAGYYCYVGSALGGARARLARHFRKQGKRRRWHVDYLRERGEVEGAVLWVTRCRAECTLKGPTTGQRSTLGLGFYYGPNRVKNPKRERA